VDNHSKSPKDKMIYDLTDISNENDHSDRQEVIVVDGRGYNGQPQEAEEIFTLVDVIEDPQIKENIYNDILKRAEEMIEKMARKMVPEIAERIIREEIEKIKNGDHEIPS